MMAPTQSLFSAALALLIALPARASDKSTANPIKRLPLSSDGRVYLSLGGEIRERFEYYSEPFFGLRGVAQDDYLLHRVLLGADLHAGDHWHFFVQFGNSLEVGKVAARAPTDVDEFD